MKTNFTDTNTPVILDNSSVEPTPTPIVKQRAKRIDLATVDDVRLEMASLYRNMKAGIIDPSDGTKMAYVLSQIGRLIEVNDIERRIELLELTIKQRNTHHE